MSSTIRMTESRERALMNVPKLLLDGYNVLFQSQLVGTGRGRNWLAAARQRLLQLINQSATDAELATMQIVFDAPQFGVAPAPEQQPSGLTIHYATDHAEADDFLEEIIRSHPTPKLLTVVSSDQRIRRCARARRATSITADQFLDELQRRATAVAAAAEPTKAQPAAPIRDPQQPLSATEVAYWLKQFGSNDSQT